MSVGIIRNLGGKSRQFEETLSVARHYGDFNGILTKRESEMVYGVREYNDGWTVITENSDLFNVSFTYTDNSSHFVVKAKKPIHCVFADYENFRNDGAKVLEEADFGTNETIIDTTATYKMCTIMAYAK